mmetsp:Transcript_9710/g.17511  ORF Transcript_9710/g.17511 Transcript_9710/m.17511 type:complete len:107 (-) Transcript_9710:60-380(-)
MQGGRYALPLMLRVADDQFYKNSCMKLDIVITIAIAAAFFLSAHSIDTDSFDIGSSSGFDDGGPAESIGRKRAITALVSPSRSSNTSSLETSSRTAYSILALKFRK